MKKIGGVILMLSLILGLSVVSCDNGNNGDEKIFYVPNEYRNSHWGHINGQQAVHFYETTIDFYNLSWSVKDLIIENIINKTDFWMLKTNNNLYSFALKKNGSAISQVSEAELGIEDFNPNWNLFVKESE